MRRHHRQPMATTRTATDIAASHGYTGAKYVMAPEAPIAATTSLLRTGQPAASHASHAAAPPAAPARGVGPGRPATPQWLPTRTAVSTEVATHTG